MRVDDNKADLDRLCGFQYRIDEGTAGTKCVENAVRIPAFRDFLYDSFSDCLGDDITHNFRMFLPIPRCVKSLLELLQMFFDGRDRVPLHRLSREV